MTAVPPNRHSRGSGFRIVFQPLKGNDGRAATLTRIEVMAIRQFQPLKGNDGRAAE